MDFQLTPENYLAQPPAPESLVGIGVVGCGSIVRQAHLPAYRAWNLPVVACCDLNEQAAGEVAREFSIPFHTSKIEELLDREDVQIVDLAVHAAIRADVIERIASHPKKPRAILSQKPLALNPDDARRIVETCEQAGIVLAVNQQQRWSPAHRALKFIIDSGILGHVYSLLHIVRGNQDDPKSWYVGVENFNIVDHGIHFIDLSRHFLNQTPERVKATATRVPGQHAVTPMIYSILCEYQAEANTMATLHFNNIVPSSQATGRFEWIADGTQGTARMKDWGTIELALRGDAQPREIKIESPKYPINFAAVMGELMTALAENRPPQTSGRDNLSSIGIAYAAVESSNTGRTVSLAT